MKRLLVVFAVMCMFVAPALFAQDHAEVGVYGDYFRLGLGNGRNSNLFGLGGNVLVNVAHHAQVGGEVSYDFEQAFNLVNPTGITTTRVSTRLVHGLFGLEIKGAGWFRPFVTAKGGFINWDIVNPGTGIVSGFGLGSSTHWALYPGGGIEAFAGPIGLRVQVGDFIYWNNGSHNNLRVTFGPQLRF